MRHRDTTKNPVAFTLVSIRRVVVGALLFLALGSVGCREVNPPPLPPTAADTAEKFGIALAEPNLDRALELCAPSVRDTVRQAIHAWPEKAAEFLASRPGMLPADAAAGGRLLRERFDPSLIDDPNARAAAGDPLPIVFAVKGHAKLLRETAPNQGVLPVDVLIPAIYQIAKINQTEARGVYVVRDELPVEKVDGQWLVAGFFTNNLLDERRSPNLAVHGLWMRLRSGQTGPEVAAFFVPAARERFGLVLREWNRVNASFIDQSILPHLADTEESGKANAKLWSDARRANPEAGKIHVESFEVSPMSVLASNPPRFRFLVRAKMPGFVPAHYDSSKKIFALAPVPFVFPVEFELAADGTYLVRSNFFNCLIDPTDPVLLHQERHVEEADNAAFPDDPSPVHTLPGFGLSTAPRTPRPTTE